MDNSPFKSHIIAAYLIKTVGHVHFVALSVRFLSSKCILLDGRLLLWLVKEHFRAGYKNLFGTEKSACGACSTTTGWTNTGSDAACNACCDSSVLLCPASCCFVQVVTIRFCSVSEPSPKLHIAVPSLPSGILNTASTGLHLPTYHYLWRNLFDIPHINGKLLHPDQVFCCQICVL